MKTAYGKDIRRTISKNAKRFIAILAITALGLTAFAGISAACRDMYIGADNFYDQQKLFDIRVLSTLGLTDEDVEALEGMEKVEIADGAYSETIYTTVNGLRQSADMIMLSAQGMNAPYLVEGALPQSQGEIAVTQKYLDESGKSIGDTLTIEEELDEGDADPADETDADEAVDDSSDASDDSSDSSTSEIDWDVDIEIEEEPETPSFLNTLYTITAVVIDPMDVANNGGTAAFRSNATTDYTFFVTPADVSTDVYTSIYLKLYGLEELDCYSDEYVKAVDSAIDAIEAEIMRQREQARYDAVMAEALGKITDAENTMNESFDEADQQFADAWAELEDAKQELSDGEAELTKEEQDALRQLADARAELESGKQQLADAEAQLADALTQLQAGQASYDTGLAAYNDGFAQYQATRDNVDALNQGVQQGIPGSRAAIDGLLTQYPTNTALAADPNAVAQFTTAAGTITGVLDGMAAFFTQAGSADAAALLSGISSAVQGALTSADYLLVQTTLMALDAPSDPSNPSSPTPTAIMQNTLTATYTELDAAKAQLDAALQQLAQGKAELDSGWAEYNAGIAQMETARADLAAGEVELNAEEAKALREIADAWREIADGKQELEDGEAELLENEQAYAEKKEEAEQLLADAYEELKDIDMAQWYVQDRTSIDSYSGLDSDIGSIDAIGKAFPVLFLVVAVLISLTTMTRMVEEERGLIGTYKALGYSNLAIGWKYVCYALLASLSGGIVGSLLGFIALPKLLIVILQAIYIIPNIPLYFDIPYALIGMLLFTVSIMVATTLACRSELRRTPASLMRPKAPKAGSRILLERVPFIWNHLKFLNKVTARNLFRYKKRLLMTVIGIAGCTALVLAGFAIRDSVTDLIPRQYKNIYRYDLLVVADAEDNSQMTKYLDGETAIADYQSVQYGNIKVLNAAGDSESMQIVVVPTGASLEQYIATPDLKGVQAQLDDGGILITQNAATLLGVSAGDTVTLQNLQLDRHSTTVSNVVENYLGNNVFISQPLYESLFGDYEPNAAYAHLTDEVEDSDAYAEALLDQDFVMSSASTEAMKEQFTTDFAILNYVIYILIVLAAGLAFVVLFTLSNTNISERIRELATIKVLGFFDREVHAYANKETLILTLIGVLAGLPLGYLLSGLLLASLKMPSIQFVLVIEPVSYVLAAVISFCFALLVNLITNRVLDKINMVEALKSVE